MNNEPVAWFIQAKIWHEFTFSKPAEDSEDVVITPLYTHPSEHDLGIAEAIGFDKGYKAATAKVFTDAEVDAIYSAMGDYSDYGDEETELANSIRNKLS
jgi:hypothetical protein